MTRLTPLLLVVPFLVGAPVAGQKKEPEKKKDAPPKLLYAAPLVATPGAKQKLVLRGKNLDGVKDATVSGADGAAVKVLASRKAAVPNNYPADRIGDSELEVELTLPKDAKSGAAVVAVGPGGPSEPYKLLVPDDGIPTTAEKEPNDGYDTAQPLTLPAAVVGTVHAEKNPDVYRFTGKAGQKLRAEVTAARYGSPLDAILTLVDANRQIVAANDDSDGSPDPRIVVTLPRDGTYYLSLIDAHDLGGGGFAGVDPELVAIGLDPLGPAAAEVVGGSRAACAALACAVGVDPGVQLQPARTRLAQPDGQWVITRVLPLGAGEVLAPGLQAGLVEGVAAGAYLQEQGIEADACGRVAQAADLGLLLLGAEARFARPIDVGDGGDPGGAPLAGGCSRWARRGRSSARSRGRRGDHGRRGLGLGALAAGEPGQAAESEQMATVHGAQTLTNQRRRNMNQATAYITATKAMACSSEALLGAKPQARKAAYAACPSGTSSSNLASTAATM